MDLNNEPHRRFPQPPTSRSTEAKPVTQENRESSNQESSEEGNNPRHYPPRECRICLETVLPTFEAPESESLPAFLRPWARVMYESSDPELGRLLRPCKCKGSSRYVHEGCLRKWRHADPDYGKRNFWYCPTCGFRYRLERLTWARWISSPLTRMMLTLAILLLAIFLLGFIADPIINLYLDPAGTIYFSEFWQPSTLSDTLLPGKTIAWVEHLIKGLASLGFLSFVKVLLAIPPWQWWTVRTSRAVTSGRNTGRSRVNSIGWLVILIGVGSFLWAVYRGVRTWSGKALEKAGERVMDVPLPEDDDANEILSDGCQNRPKRDD